MSQSFKLSRRAFFKVSLVAGISVCIAPWSQEALAELFEERLLTPVRWDPRTNKTAFRIDGIAKVTGQKIFAQDIRARDMPHWPKQQGHAFIVRIPCADRIFQGVDLGYLGPDLQPDRVVTAESLERDGLVTQKSGTDLRERILRLTASGQRRLDRSFAHWEAAQRAFLSEFGQDRFEVLRSLLTNAAEASKTVGQATQTRADL